MRALAESAGLTQYLQCAASFTRSEEHLRTGSVIDDDQDELNNFDGTIDTLKLRLG